MTRVTLALMLAVAVGWLPQGTEPSLTVMTFNIRYGTANDGADGWPFRRRLAFEVIREQAPDVIGLQEALRFQLDELGLALRGYGEVGVGRDDGREAGEYAAILYREARFELLASGTFWFAETPAIPGSVDWGATIPRICTWARLHDREAERAFYIYNVHLDHQSRESRERSVRLLAERIAARQHNDPVIVTGDFNAGEESVAIRYLTETGEVGPRLRDSFRVVYPDATRVGTFNGFRGDDSGPKIDYVFVDESWQVRSAEILKTSPGGSYPSDHFPVVATLDY
jgi:endonuclease/exonuclease/phosphatase family metal-dependent hydrolase